MAGKNSKNPTLLTTSVIIATAWDTLDPSAGSQCNQCSQLDGSDKVKEEGEQIHVDDISPAEASLGFGQGGYGRSVFEISDRNDWINDWEEEEDWAEEGNYPAHSGNDYWGS